LRAALTEVIARAPSGAAPLDVSFESFRAVLPLLEANPRHAVIASFKRTPS